MYVVTDRGEEPITRVIVSCMFVTDRGEEPITEVIVSVCCHG